MHCRLAWKKYLAAALAALSAATVITGCGGDDEDHSFRVQGVVDRPSQVSVVDLKLQPGVTQTVTFNAGTAPQTHTYTGANLYGVLQSYGVQTDATRKNDVLNRYVLATGSDGYKVVFALGELSPDFGNIPSIVAYAETTNGVSANLGSTDGPFRVTAPGDVKGGRYVSNLVRIDARTSGSTAAATGGGVSSSFAVSGAVNTPRTFDLAALQALPAVTQTVGGTAYTGVSLWTLLNTATGIKTEAGAKNPTLAMYAVATGSDGYKAMVSLGEIDAGFGNRNAVVAYSINGAGLGANGVARLVVPGDVKLGRSVSNLVSIEVFAAAP